MKQQLVEWARRALRALPLRARHKKQLQIFCFTYFPALFQHLPNFQLWSLRHPDIAAKALRKINLPERRAETLSSGLYASQNRGILMISHSLGGGTEHHVQQLGEKLHEEQIESWVLRAIGGEWVKLMPLLDKEAEPLIYHVETERKKLEEQLSQLNIALIHVHHLVDFPANAKALVQRLAAALQVPYDFTAHDYLAICPRYTLYDEAVRGYCGEPDVKRCTGCVRTYGSVAGKEVDVKGWRADYADFLKEARHIYTPDLDVRNRLSPYLPQSTLLNRPHWDEAEITPLPLKREAGEPLKILTLGAIAPHKGSMVLKECAEDAKARNLPLEFTLIGFSDIDWQLKKYMRVTGPYTPKELPELLKKGEYDAVFFPAIWPETFNYTLSEVLHFGLYPICFDIGAIARRVAELGYGSVLPYEYYRQPEAINDALLELEIPEAPVEKLQAAQVRYGNYGKEYYGL